METATHRLADYYSTTYSSMVILQCTCGHSERVHMGIERTYQEAARIAEAKMLEHMGTDTLEDDEDETSERTEEER